MPLPRRISRAAYLVTLSAAAAAAACAAPSTPDDRSATPAGTTTIAAGSVTVVAGDGAIEIRNGTERPIFTFAVERTTATLIDWAPCLPLPNVRCAGGVDAGQTLHVPYQSINGYDPGEKEAIVYWWTPVSDAAGNWRAENMQSVVVKL